MKNWIAAPLIAASLVLSACGEPTKKDILDKAEGIETKAELEKALGEPDDIGKVGPIERWTYEASDGTVTFVITGERVSLKAAGG
jgi:hypothetical protein